MKRNYILLLILAFSMTLNSCKVGRFIIYNFADINDHKKFPARTVENGETEFKFPKSEEGKVPKEMTLKNKSYPFEPFLEDNKTVAFLIIQNDTIQYENYWKKYNKTINIFIFCYNIYKKYY